MIKARFRRWAAYSLGFVLFLVSGHPAVRSTSLQIQASEIHIQIPAIPVPVGPLLTFAGIYFLIPLYEVWLQGIKKFINFIKTKRNRANPAAT